MSQLRTRSRESGVVLVVGLLLLLVMTIVAVASLSSTHMQERMAGNARTQALAFEVASSGAASALEFYFSQRDAGVFGTTPFDNDCGTRNHAGWLDDGSEALTPWVTGATGDLIDGARLSQTIYCLRATYPDGEAEIKSHPFVLSRGEVLAADGETVVARRDVEVRLEFGSPESGEPDCTALCFPYCASGDSLRFPTSNAFKVDGDGAPAITTGTLECATAVTSAIRTNRIGNYDGGVVGTDSETGGTLGYPWGSPADVDKFRLELLAAAESGTVPPGYSTEFVNGNLSTSGNRVFGTTTTPQVTYIKGDADMGGNVSGAGILVVEGDLKWNGTPEYKGLILVLGGSFEVYGGGQGGDPAGSLVVLNLFDSNGDVSDTFGSIDLDFRGGGTALYKYDCLLLQGLATDLTSTGWDPSCDSDGSGLATPGTPRIVSWRENLGWRTFIDNN